MRANEFITEAANVLQLDIIKNDINAQILMKKILSMTKFSHHIKLFPDDGNSDTDVIQGSKGWAYYKILTKFPSHASTVTLITVINKQLSQVTIKINELDEYIATHLGGPLHFYQIADFQSNEYRQKRDQRNTAKSEEKRYKLLTDPVFRRYVLSVLSTFINYFSITDSNAIEKAEHDYDRFSSKYGLRYIEDEIEAPIRKNVFMKLCNIYNWDYTNIAVYDEIDLHMFKAKHIDKLLYYKTIKEEITALLNERYQL